jgi:ABC-type transport system substrate-binding protein
MKLAAWERGAKAAFAAAGRTDSSGDGVLDKGGQKLSLTRSTHSEDPNRVQTIEFLQAVFKENGIDAGISIAEWPSFSGAVQNGQHQIALPGWLNIVDPDRLMYGQFRTGGPGVMRRRDPHPVPPPCRGREAPGAVAPLPCKGRGRGRGRCPTDARTRR